MLRRALRDAAAAASRVASAPRAPARLARPGPLLLAAAARAWAASSARAFRALASRPGHSPGVGSRLASDRPSPALSPLGRSGSRRSIFIQTQTTPNPASLMFLPGKPVYEDGPSKNFASAREAMTSPLAKRLFAVDGVSGVFFGAEFVTVTKTDAHEWGVLKPEVFAAIMDFYASGDPVVGDDASLEAAGTAIAEDDDEIVAMIKELLETRIRPAVAEDGRDIVFRGWDEKTGVVTVKMQGACDGCPSSSVTLKSGIENMLRHYVPEVNAVEQEAEEGAMDLLDMATMNR